MCDAQVLDNVHQKILSSELKGLVTDSIDG